jgi:hypothetical protein
MDTVQEALAAAERLLPGNAAPRDAKDPRWQAIIQVGNFVVEEPEAIWPFVLKWGSHEDEDLRTAVATCLLEHLLEYHFDLLFPRVEAAVRLDSRFANMFKQCWKMGEAKEPTRAARFDLLFNEIEKDSPMS